MLVGVAEAKAIAYARTSAAGRRCTISRAIFRQTISSIRIWSRRFSASWRPADIHIWSACGRYGKYEILGRTRDDAAGEAYDKVAARHRTGIPGRPEDRPDRERGKSGRGIKFPKAHIDGAEYDFSFSGLKSAVLNYINGCRMTRRELSTLPTSPLHSRKAVVEVLVEDSMKAVGDYGMYKFAIAGGVASNTCAPRGHEAGLRGKRREVLSIRPRSTVRTMRAMIGAAAFYEYLAGTRHGWDLNAVPNLKLGER